MFALFKLTAHVLNIYYGNVLIYCGDKNTTPRVGKIEFPNQIFKTTYITSLVRRKIERFQL